jgi:hypothetical protein
MWMHPLKLNPVYCLQLKILLRRRIAYAQMGIVRRDNPHLMPGLRPLPCKIQRTKLHAHGYRAGIVINVKYLQALFLNSLMYAVFCGDYWLALNIFNDRGVLLSI